MFEFKSLQFASANNFDLFTDKFTSAVRALKNKHNHNEFIVLYIALKKIDIYTVREFELSCSRSKIPTIDNLSEYIVLSVSATYNKNNYRLSNVLPSKY